MHPAVVVKNLGVWFDANLFFADHVRNICKTCFIQIHDLRWVRQYLTDETNALVSNCLDYCSSLFRTLSSLNMCKLQCIHNTCDSVVTNCNKYTLPVGFCCIFKTTTLVYKFLHSGHPSYFGSLLSTHLSTHCIRYNGPDKRFLEVPQFYPSVNKSPKILWQTALLLMLIWSILPQLSRVSEKRLKACLIKKAFPT